MGAHELLEVEVGENIILIELKEGGKLRVGVNLATVLLVLEIVAADVSVDIAGNRSACHLSSLVLAKEGCKLVADTSGLDKTTWGTVSGLALALGHLLLGSFKLALPLLLKRLVLALEGRYDGRKLLELSIELGGLLKDGCLK